MKNLYKALAAFQQECPVIHKGTKGYGYTYADLPAIFEIINPLMQKHGLGFTQEIQGNALVTTIFHSESGDFRESSANLIQGVTLKGMNEFQVFGSNLTYMRRYCISSALGLVTDKDTDAATPPQTATKAKEEFTPNHKGWATAKKALQGKTVTIEQIKAKYILSPKNETLLCK